MVFSPDTVALKFPKRALLVDKCLKLSRGVKKQIKMSRSDEDVKGSLGGASSSCSLQGKRKILWVTKLSQAKPFAPALRFCSRGSRERLEARNST